MNELFEYWQEHPPTHILVGAYLMGKGSQSRKYRDGVGLAEMKRAVVEAGGNLKRKLPDVYRAK